MTWLQTTAACRVKYIRMYVYAEYEYTAFHTFPAELNVSELV